MGGFGKWVVGILVTGTVAYFVLPLIGIDPSTKQFYGQEATSDAADRARARGRQEAMDRATSGRSDQ